MQDEHRLREFDGVDGAVRITDIVLNNIKHAGTTKTRDSNDTKLQYFWSFTAEQF